MAWASVVFSTALFRFATHCSTVLFVANKRHFAKKKILSKFFRKVTKDVHMSRTWYLKRFYGKLSLDSDIACMTKVTKNFCLPFLDLECRLRGSRV
jgi:hypothetical protein